MRSRDSARFGCSASAFSRSNSSGDIGTSRAVLVGQPVRVDVEHAAADAHAARRRARRGRAEDVRRSTLLTRAASSRGSNGFGHVVVGAHLEADDAVDDGGGGRQHDDGDLRVALAQVAREAQAVLAGHVDVDQREVDRLLRRPARAPPRRFRRRDRVAVARRSTPPALRARPARRRRSGSWLSVARSRIPSLWPCRLRSGSSPAGRRIRRRIGVSKPPPPG